MTPQETLKPSDFTQATALYNDTPLGLQKQAQYSKLIVGDKQLHISSSSAHKPTTTGTRSSRKKEISIGRGDDAVEDVGEKGRNCVGAADRVSAKQSILSLMNNCSQITEDPNIIKQACSISRKTSRSIHSIKD